MNKQDREYLEEIIIKANQSGKQETSGLFREVKKELERINESIRENGEKIKLNSKRISDVEDQMERIKGLDENGLKLYIEKEQQEERKKSDESYAVKLVEKIVFWGAAMIGTAVVGALLSQVIR